MITHIKDPNSDKCIVFVHGLGGSINTFKSFKEYLNRKWNISYGILIFFFVYYRELLGDKLKFTIIDKLLFACKALFAKRNLYNAIQLEKYIDSNCADCKDIILVAHSMGGLISRQYLVNCRNNQKDIRKIKMLITYATPHNGSYVANYVSFLGTIPILKQIYNFITRLIKTRIFPQIGDLTSFSTFISNLNKEWTNLGLESKVKFIRVIANYDQVVKPESANLHNRDFGNTYHYDYDHFNIITPPINSVEFPPIDLLLERISLLSFSEEYFDELEEEINYDDTDNDTF